MQRYIGRVIGCAMRKTIKVCVERLVKHPKYPKILKVRKHFLVHDDHEAAVIGDLVAIEYAGKLSVRKAFKMTEIIKEARRYLHPATGIMYTAP